MAVPRQLTNLRLAFIVKITALDTRVEQASCLSCRASLPGTPPHRRSRKLPLHPLERRVRDSDQRLPPSATISRFPSTAVSPPHAALLVFFPTSTGTRIVPSDLRRRLRRHREIVVLIALEGRQHVTKTTWTFFEGKIRISSPLEILLHLDSPLRQFRRIG